MTWPRWVAMPIAALALIGGVIWVQVANGGGTYEPLQPASACAERHTPAVAAGIEGLTEQLVLIGIGKAACALDLSREELTLQLARSTTHTDTDIAALRAGLLGAVDQMKQDGSLPPASDLADEALQTADLNGLIKRAIRALPDGLINSALKTDDIVKRAITDLDLRSLLANLDDSSQLNAQVESAVTQAVKDSLKARLRNLV